TGTGAGSGPGEGSVFGSGSIRPRSTSGRSGSGVQTPGPWLPDVCRQPVSDNKLASAIRKLVEERGTVRSQRGDDISDDSSSFFQTCGSYPFSGFGRCSRRDLAARERKEKCALRRSWRTAGVSRRVRLTIAVSVGVFRPRTPVSPRNRVSDPEHPNGNRSSRLPPRVHAHRPASAGGSGSPAG